VALGGGCYDHVSGGIVILGWVPTPGTTWTHGVPLPAAPALAGIRLAAQSVYTVAPFAVIDGWSNAVWLQVGP